MSKHTPGPLTTEDIFEDGTVCVILDYPVEGGGNPIPIGCAFEVDDHGIYPKTRAEVVANAKLMAAAPDLLEACIAVRSHGYKSSVKQLHEVLRKVHDAIEKATK